jgi:2-haloacid dehalogenase
MLNTVVFDLGGVLIDWNPRHLFRHLISEEERMEYFLREVATPEWNGRQDAGRPLDEATEWLIERHPEWEELIRAYYGRWPEMISGPIEGTLAILKTIYERKSHRLLALTNWSQETFPVARKKFPWLNSHFEGILVSGEEKLIKPDPRIYELLIERYGLDPEKAVFIDDNEPNVSGAREVGLHAIHFRSPELLKIELQKLEVL